MQYAYHLSSAQNAWQDSHLVACGISAPCLWYLAILVDGLKAYISLELRLSVFRYIYEKGAFY
jgi:hypothetical protein